MISFVIPAYNNPGHVETLLASIAERCSRNNAFEAIVVDDGSSDGAIESVCRRYAFVKCIRLDSNRGAAFARNTGARHASYGLLFFLDSDGVLLCDGAEAAINLFRDPQVQAAVGAYSPDCLNPGLFRNFWALVKSFSLPHSSFSSTFYPGVGVIRKNVFEAIGGFDENIKGASVEDYEISVRLDAKGFRVHYTEALMIRTHYKNIFKSLAQSFSRSSKWVLLFSERRQFDNHTTTPLQAVGLLCGIGFLASAVLSVFGAIPAWPAAGFLAAYILLNARFFWYVGKMAGWWFVPLAVGFHLILSIVVTVGALRGTLQLALWPRRRRELLYR